MYFDKNSKNTIINRETFFTKIFEKTRTYWDFDENFQKLARHLRVKSKIRDRAIVALDQENHIDTHYVWFGCELMNPNSQL